MWYQSCVDCRTSVSDAAVELSSPTSELPNAEASTTTTSTQWAATILPEHAARPPLQCPNHARCITSRQPYWWSLFQVWFGWPFCVAMSHPVYHSWSRKPSEARRAAELHAWLGQSYDQRGSAASPGRSTGYVSCQFTPCNYLIRFWSISFIHIIKLCGKT
jgi:hypothetical protein